MLETTPVDTVGDVRELTPLRPIGAVASLLSRRLRKRPALPVVYVATDSRRAAELVSLINIFRPNEVAAVYPRWDGSSTDGVAPTPRSIGRRMNVLRRLLDPKSHPSLLVTTPEAILRRVPGRRRWNDIHLQFLVGDRIDLEDVELRLRDLGYFFDERVDEPGGAAVRGRVIEVFPAAAPQPYRIEFDDEAIVSIRSYDARSQRSVETVEQLIVDPACEEIPTHGAPAEPREALAETLFDYLDGAELILEEDTDRQANDTLSVLQHGGENGQTDYLSLQEWSTLTKRFSAAVLRDGDMSAHIPAFTRERNPDTTLELFLRPLIARGYRIVLAGPSGHVLRVWRRRFERVVDAHLAEVHAIDEVRAAEAGQSFLFEAPINQGFVDHDDRLVCIALRDLAGQGVATSKQSEASFSQVEPRLRLGDAVVHFVHGVGILEGLETSADGETEVLRLRYADNAVLLTPLKEIGTIWRYGGPETDVTLDRLKGGSWLKQRNLTVTKIGETAQRMVEAIVNALDAGQSR